jgi:transcriptional regulator with XRE-family HTH domain
MVSDSFGPRCPFLARVVTQYDMAWQRRGTGILVSPEHVLTCAHEVAGINLETWDSGKYADAPIMAMISFGEVPGPVIERSGKVLACAEPDMALLHLNKPVPLAPAQFVSGLRANHDSALSRLQPCALGFSAGKLTQCRISGRVLSAFDWATQGLVNLQVQGGLLPGMSGGALVAPRDNGSVCFGMSYIGGGRGAMSRLIPSDVLLAFLKRHGVPFPMPFPASEYFAESLGQLIQRRREARGFSRRQLAVELGIAEETLRSWEKEASAPTGEHRRRLFESVIAGDPEAVEAWQQLLGLHDGEKPPPDPISALRPLATPGLLSVQIIDPERTIGMEPLPQLQRLLIGSRVKLVVRLPWPACVSILLVQGMESVPRTCYCLDPLLDLKDALPQGATVLPHGDPLPVGDPPSLNCLVLLARRSGTFPWNGSGASGLYRIPEESVMGTVHELAATQGSNFLAALYEFETCRS